MIPLLSRLVRPRFRARRSDLSVTLYTRAGCCCCHTALDVLKNAQRRHGYSLIEIDVDSDHELAARHGESVPVVEVNGKIRFKGIVNPVLLERLIVAEARGN